MKQRRQISNTTMTANNSIRRRHNTISNSNNNGNAILVISVLALLTILVVLGIFINHLPKKVSYMSNLSKSSVHGEERTWHGGHPEEDKPGSCWCGGDEYCMCTPSVAIDIVIYSKTEEGKYSVWVVRRRDTEQLATIGGFVDVGESAESAVQREALEETGIVIPNEQINSSLKLIGVYSDPRRDNRRHIVSIGYALELTSTMKTKDGGNKPRSGDDAKDVIKIPLDQVGVKYKGEDWYADHLTILNDFKEQIRAKNDATAVAVRDGELYDDIARSTC